MGERAVYRPGKDIVGITVETMKQEIRERVEKSEGDFVVSLEGVEMIDSKGIGLLIATYNSLTPKGRKLVLAKVIPDIVRLLRTMRLDRHFSIE